MLAAFRRGLAALAGAVALLLVTAGCASLRAGGAPAEAGQATLRLGYFPNVTHAPALVGIGAGHFAEALGDTALVTQAFNAGPSVIEALNAGAIDASFIGPNPAINGYLRSGGQALRIVAGSTSGGAQLIVSDNLLPRANPDATGAIGQGAWSDVGSFIGATIATPQLGNTQDVAARWWFQEHGLSVATGAGADVSITPTDNALSFTMFARGQIDGAWVPEPWASRLVLQADGHLYLDERDLWPGGRFVTVHLIVATAFLEAHPEKAEALIAGLLAAEADITANPVAAREAVNDQIEASTGQRMPADVLERAFGFLEFTVDPVAPTLRDSLDHAVAVGVSEPGVLAGIYDLRLLNGLLRARGRSPVSAAGLGLE